MHSFTVWAPAARRVDLVLADIGTAMTARGGGWWTLQVDQAGAGTDYQFSVDGGPPYPDPRSGWQPRGVHGPSRVFDPTAHEWGDTGWTGRQVRGRVFYELHIGTFTPEGTFDAAIGHLKYLAKLGVQVVTLMPVAAFPGRWGWGYEGSAPFAVHEPYGGPAGLQRFVDACHKVGLAVCLDVVYNHLGPAGNYLPQFGPYLHPTHETPWGAAVNLDGEGSAEVRRYLLDNATWWFREFHVDGLRLDAVHALHDTSQRHFLAELSDHTADLAEQLGRPLALIAESDLNDPLMVTPTASGGMGMTAQWDDDVHHALRALLTDDRDGYYVDFGDLPTLAKALTTGFVHDGTWSTYRGKPWGAPVDVNTISGHSFLGYFGTHDQIGNRALGDRPGHCLSDGRLAIAATIVLTSAFTPMLFMGEEFSASTPWQFFSDHTDDDLAQAVIRGRHAEFAAHGWDAAEIPDPQDPHTRDASVLRWDELTRPPHSRLLAWYRALLTLRRSAPELSDGDLRTVKVVTDTERKLLVIARGPYRIVVNLGRWCEKVELDAPTQHVVLAWDGATLGSRSVLLDPDTVAIVRVDDTPTVRAAVTDYLLRTAAELEQAVTEDDVHDMRVACRRTRSVLRAHARLWPRPERDRSVDIAEQARTIARALSDDRDSEVVGEVIEDWAAADGWDDAHRDAALAEFYPAAPSAPEQPEQAPASGDEPEPFDARAAARELAGHVREFLDRTRWRKAAHRPATVGLAAFRGRAAARVLQRWRDALGTAPTDDPDELWHLVRKGAKRLRYTGEVGAAVKDPGSAAVAGAAKAVQTVIGDLQDARLVLDRMEQLDVPSDTDRPDPDQPGGPDLGAEALELTRRRANDTIERLGVQIDPTLSALWASDPRSMPQP